MQNKIKDTVRLVGLGDFGSMIKETVCLNTAIAVYLIKNQKFNKIVLSAEDFRLRQLNAFLKGAGTEIGNQQFDTLFDITFRNTGNFTKEFKNFIAWIYNYNKAQPVNNKVQLIGANLVFPPADKLPELNNYFIDTYIHPNHILFAKTYRAAWKNYSDSLVLREMKIWSEMAARAKALPPALEDQMNLDIENRIWNYTLATKANNNPLDIIGYSQAFAFNVVLRLMSRASNKIIFFNSNNAIADATNNLYVKDSVIANIPLLGQYYRERYKNMFFSTAITFSDTGDYIETSSGKNVESVEKIKGNEYTKKLFSKKEIYALPEDKLAMEQIELPAITAGRFRALQKVELKMKNKPQTPPFDMIFIFKTLTLNIALD